MNVADLHPHPQADLVPWADADSHDSLMADIDRHGIQVPLDVTADGTVLDGRTRLAIARVLSIETVPVRVVDVADPVAYMIRMAVMRRHLSPATCRALAARMLQAEPTRSDRSVARAVGIDHKTVGAVREALESTGEIPQSDTRTGADGRTRSLPFRDQVAADQAAMEAHLDPVEPSEPTPETARPVVIERNPDGLGRQAPIMLSESDEWYTPADVVARVVATLGTIDLDPCAEPARSIPAARHLTAEDDGLRHPWVGRLFVNPPYSRVGDFALRLGELYRAGTVTEAVLLAHARTETRWWQTFPSEVICLIARRVRFVSGATGEPAGASTSPSAALYLGPDPTRFIAAFADAGRIYQEVRS